jgi:hypothetical protein
MRHPSITVKTSGKKRLPLRERRSAELRRQQRTRYASRIYLLGERVQFELVEHLIRTFDLDEDVVRRILDRFAGLDPVALRAIGAEVMPPIPLRSVSERR